MTPLDGILVLDLTRLLPGAVATQWLADFGAEVIKIEQPGTGDYARHNFSGVGENPIFALTNRGKRSLAVDLKDAQGKQTFLKLAGRADVIIEGFRPGVMDRLGIGSETVRSLNRRVIYASLTGYGSEGKYAALAGHDINYLALSGVLDLIGAKDGPPVLAGIQIADIPGGSMQVLIGILLALEARHRSGQGQRVGASMFAGAAAMMPIPIAAVKAGHPVERGSALLNGGYACYSVYAAAEGSYVAVGALEPKFWGNLCRELGCGDLTGEQFADDQSKPKARLAEIFLQATAEEWFARIGSKDCCVTPVRRLKDAITDYPASPIPELSETPGIAATTVPELGEYNPEVSRIEVIRATSEQAPILANLLQLYAHDFSEFIRLELDADGRFSYKYLPLYWSEPDRHPFLIRIDGGLAGFALVKKGSEISGDENAWDMAEFFVVKGHRRRGVGIEAAHDVWRRFQGRWEVRVMDSNRAGRDFWDCAIAAFTRKTTHSIRVEKAGEWWHVFTFQSREAG